MTQEPRPLRSDGDASTGDGAGPGTRPKRRKRRAALAAYGEPMVWLTGGALIICLVMILGLLGLILWQGSITFWPHAVTRVVTHDGRQMMGEVTRDEKFEPGEDWDQKLDDMPAAAATEARKAVESGSKLHRDLIRVGNFELTNKHFVWIEEYSVKEQNLPQWAVVVERLEWGRFYGMPEACAYVHPVEAGRVAARRGESREVCRREARAEAEREAAGLKLSPGAALEYVVERREGGENVPHLVRPGEVKPEDLVVGLAETWRGREAAWKCFDSRHSSARALWHKRRGLEKVDVGKVNAIIEHARLSLKEVELDEKPPAAWLNVYGLLKRARETEANAVAEANERLRLVTERYGKGSEQARAAARQVEETSRTFKAETGKFSRKLAKVERAFGRPSDRYLRAQKETESTEARARGDFRKIMAEIAALDGQMEQYRLEMSTVDGHTKLMGLADVVRAYPANQLGFFGKVGVYFSRWYEFLFDAPREANSEGGVWPAIIGTVTMTLIMSIAVVPFGVLAALYLREYAKAGAVVSTVRIAINNLAGVPSIVFGVFGLGFFCYLVGGYIDGGPRNIGVAPWPPLYWWLALIAAVIIAVGAFFAGMMGRTRPGTEVTPAKKMLRTGSVVLWLVMTAVALLLVVYAPHFHGLYRAELADNNPTLGTDGLLWASLTLALLTAPVVIVATEEALAAVPNSMREGSYACGASKWQTIKRIVLPRAMPGIMTGMVLAIARGAGEVAPLMLVGAEKLAPALPVDGQFPFVHLDRTFMHLGFHIYDLGFQSPNAEAAKPMVFSTTLLLIAIVATLNVAAVWLRKRLRRKFASSQF